MQQLLQKAQEERNQYNEQNHAFQKCLSRQRKKSEAVVKKGYVWGQGYRSEAWQVQAPEFDSGNKKKGGGICIKSFEGKRNHKVI